MAGNTSFERRWRLDGIAALVTMAVAAVGVVIAGDRVSALEERIFRLFNDLPGILEPAMWAGQVLGVLVVPLALAVPAFMLGHRRLALALVLLVPAKLLVEYRVIKEVTDRQRPAVSICDSDLSCLHLRHAPEAGVSIPSGHAMIAMGIWWLVAPYLSRRWQAITLVACLLVPVARMYLGAHNPLDVVVGGAAGIAVAAVINLAVGVPTARSGDSAAAAGGQFPDRN